MTRYFIFTAALLLVLFNGSAATAKAQSGSEKAAQRAEKFRQQIKALGVGERVKIIANTFDTKKYKGYVSESNDTSFTVIDKKGTPTIINYADVKSFYKPSKFSGFAAGVALGATVGGLVITYFVLKSLGG